MQDLFKIVLENVISEVSLEQLKQQFVDSGKVKESDFKEVETASGGKSAYATWLLKKISDKLIKPEDIYKYKNYFNTFERRKKDYEYKDINQYKTSDDLTKFISTSTSLKDKEEKDPSQAKGLEKSDKYKQYELGSVDGFKVYEIPKGRKDLYGMSCDLGSGTEWCTATGKTKRYFDSYIESGPLYVFIKPNSDEKYQFSIAENQYMDKNDNKIHLEKHKSKFEFLESSNINIPVEIKIEATLPVKNEDLKVQGSLNLYGHNIKELPEGLVIKGDLWLAECKYLKTLPNKLNVFGSIYLNFSGIEKLPDNLVIGENLDLSFCNNLKLLPKGLETNNKLILTGSEGIRTFPKNLNIGGLITLNNYFKKIFGKEEITQADLKSHPEVLS